MDEQAVVVADEGALQRSGGVGTTIVPTRRIRSVSTKRNQMRSLLVRWMKTD